MYSARFRRFELGLFFVLAALGPALRATEEPVPTKTSRFRARLLVDPIPASPDEQRLFEEGLEVLEARKFGTWPAPSSSIASPSGYGAQWTEFFAGISLQNRPRFRTKANGTGFVGFGLGNARTLAALEVSIGLHGLIPPGDKGALNLKLHRLLPGEVGVAVGWDNVLGWGGTDGKSAFYLAISKTYQLKASDKQPFSMLSMHAGIGNGGYRSEEAVFTDQNTLGWFASVGVRVFAPMTVIANWSGQDLFAGLSFTPFKSRPFNVTIAAQDLTGRAGDGVRYLMSFAYSESIYRLSPF
jgi:hypothetical protein